MIDIIFTNTDRVSSGMSSPFFLILNFRRITWRTNFFLDVRSLTNHSSVEKFWSISELRSSPILSSIIFGFTLIPTWPIGPLTMNWKLYQKIRNYEVSLMSMKTNNFNESDLSIIIFYCETYSEPEKLWFHWVQELHTQVFELSGIFHNWLNCNTDQKWDSHCCHSW